MDEPRDPPPAGNRAVRDLARSDHRAVLAVLFTGVLMGALDIAIIGPALPAVRDAFGVDERAASWMVTIYVLFNLVGTPLMAKLSDRFGRRAVYAVDVAIFGGGSLLVALAPEYGGVLVGRAIQGLGAGGIFPVASAVIGDVFPPARRGAALGLIGAVFGVAFLVGPILGGLLLLLGWPWLFLINLPIAAVVIVAALRVLPAAGAAEPRPFDWAGMALLATSLTALALALNQLDAADLLASVASPAVWPLLLVGAAAGLGFVAVERRAADPVIRPGLFRSRQVGIVSGLSLGAGLTESAVIFVPALLVATFGVTTSRAAFMLLPILVAMGISAPLLGRLVDRMGARAVVVLSGGLIAGGMGVVAAYHASLTIFYGAGIAIGVGLAGLMGSSLRYVMLNEAPREDRGAAQGILTVFISIGQLAGAAVLGALIASGDAVAEIPSTGLLPGYTAAFALVAVVMTGLTLTGLGLRSRREARRLATPAASPRNATASGTGD